MMHHLRNTDHRLFKMSLILLLFFIFIFPTHGSEEEKRPEQRKLGVWHHPKVHKGDYDPATHDLYDLLSKIRFKGTVILINDLEKQATIGIGPRHDCEHHHQPSCLGVLKEVLETKADALEDFFQDLFGIEDSSDDEDKPVKHVVSTSVIATNQSLIIRNFNPLFHEIHIQKPKSVMNLISVQQGLIKLSLSLHQRPVFPLPLKPFDFHPHLFKEIEDLPEWVRKKGDKILPFGPQYPPCEHMTEEQFRKEFDSHLVFMTMIAAAQEGLKDSTTLFTKRAQLFQLLNYTKRIQECLPVHTLKPKIPLVTHTIWLTNPKEPKEMPDRYIDWLLHSVKIMPEEEGWEHCLWIQDNDLVPQTCKKLRHTGVKVQQVYMNKACSVLNPLFALKFKLRDLFEQAVRENKFGRASDILRVEVLYRKGGIYKDTDYRFSQSLRLLNTWCDGYACVEPMSTFLGNALIAMRVKHPVMKEAMRLIRRNLTDATKPKYIKDHEKDQAFATIMTTGPMMLSFAFNNAAGQGNNVDVAFPPALFYPSVISQAYPQKEVLKPEDAVHPEAAGVHFWETSWAPTAAFGSLG